MKFVATIVAAATLLVPLASAADCIAKAQCSGCESRQSMDDFVKEYCSENWDKLWIKNKGSAYVMSTGWNYDFQCENALKDIIDSCYDHSVGGVINDTGNHHMTAYFCTCA